MNNNFEDNNRLFLRGEVVSEPRFSHEVYGEGFYELFLSVKRLSDQCDVIPITISERLIEEGNLEIGRTVTVSGQFRSYNKVENGKSRLMLTAFVRELLRDDEVRNPNMICLSGYVCKPTIYRTTPFQREICDVLVAVNRAYNKSDYIPAIAWGRNARYLKNIPVGEKITVWGRIQSREYQKREGDQVVTKTAYEISISRVVTGQHVDFDAFGDIERELSHPETFRQFC